ncbi:transglutaminase family protein [Fibrella aquatilis]|uniref:Transglutaminase family protein n=1 Tax=Fibrella aquatilis TaxID=2817059 RepID=A0A939G4H9_9BACT|nr:transglutaminase family protein [Fibrella aquatilis]MBO0932217.1 transglutaminase family protein [Fibrella aquatilis]
MHLSVWHQLRYRYDQPVVLNPHTVYLYPRTYPYQRLQHYDLQIDPVPSKVVRNVDVEGNVQQIIYFAGPTDHLTITTETTVDSEPFNSLDFVLFPFDTQHVPFEYASDLQPLLAQYLVRDSITQAVEVWARQIAGDVSWQTVPFLLALSDTIRQFVYVVREEGAPLPPEQTLRDRCGSCRDYTTLYMAACRSLGLAARFVSGYLFGSAQQQHQLHAWAEVYLPGAGWRGFDPTENTVVVNKHIFLASSAHAELTAPVSGTFTGRANSTLEADVKIKGSGEC